jgi:uncharacterized protein
MEKSALIIFLKYPEVGKVKTRLAKVYNETFATEFYRLCVEKLIRDLRENFLSETNVFLFCSDDQDIPKLKKWLGNDFICKPQEGFDLGKRMENAFTQVFNSGCEQAIIIGTDIPDINSEIIKDAFGLLNKYDFVIGPSKDGGYYLLGMNKNHPGIFEGINWSTNEVLGETIQKLNYQNFTYILLPELIDVDTSNSLEEWVKHKKDDPGNSLVRYVIQYKNV